MGSTVLFISLVTPLQVDDDDVATVDVVRGVVDGVGGVICATWM